MLNNLNKKTSRIPQLDDMPADESRWFEFVLPSILILIGVGIRLIQISQPFIDVWSWRQADVAMIAENFYRNGFHFFYPQINWAGNAPGYVGTEFPLVPFLAAVLYAVFGVQNWIGRSISVIFFAASAPFLYLLARKVSNQKSTFYATAIYILMPLGIFAGRSFMPDMASLSFSIAALYFFGKWLECEKSSLFFILAIFTTSLAILVKLPAVILGLPLLYLAWKKYEMRLLFQRRLWIFALASLLPVLVWYEHAHQLSAVYFPYHFFGEDGIKMISGSAYGRILVRTATSSLTLPVFLAAIAGSIFLPSRGPWGRVFHGWLVAMVLFIFFAGYGNRHPWYQLPLVPIAAVFAGQVIDFGSRRLTKITGGRTVSILACAVFFILLAYFSYNSVRPLYNPWAAPFLKAGNEVNRIAPANALVIIPGSGDPTALYHSKRKGWHSLGNNLLWDYPRDSQEAIRNLENLRKQGAGYLVLTSDVFWYLETYKDFQVYLDSTYPRIRSTTDSIIFDLTNPKGSERVR